MGIVVNKGVKRRRAQKERKDKSQGQHSKSQGEEEGNEQDRGIVGLGILWHFVLHGARAWSMSRCLEVGGS